ncbi:metal ABC transporter solute-binding protein, Zn/Mn family [Oceaniferula marina]|nr:zinc ABC transporter substrate-binding protein [Oceaniferula marina]
MLKKLCVIVLVLAGMLAGLFILLPEGGAEEEMPEGAVLRVVCTSTMVTDMVKVIGAERVYVYGMMGPGVDPHSYQVVSRDTLALKKADLVFYSGLHLEGKMQSSLERRAEREGDTFAVTDAIDKGKLLQPQDDFAGYHDPHVWGDPTVWADTVDVVVQALTRADPEGKDGYQTRGEAYRKELESLDRWVKRRVAELPLSQRVVVTSHDAFYYFGKAYGLEVRGLQGVSTNAESGIKDREELVAFIKQRGLKMIFPESSVNAKGIKAVASEAKVKVSEHELFSDAMGTPGDVVDLHGERYDKGTYLGMIKHNVNTIVDGLK